MPLVGELYQMVKLTYQPDFPDRELSAASELQHYLWRKPSARQPYSSRGFRPIPGVSKGYIEGEGCGEPGELQGLGALHVSGSAGDYLDGGTTRGTSKCSSRLPRATEFGPLFSISRQMNFKWSNIDFQLVNDVFSNGH